VRLLVYFTLTGTQYDSPINSVFRPYTVRCSNRQHTVLFASTHHLTLNSLPLTNPGSK